MIYNHIKNVTMYRTNLIKEEICMYSFLNKKTIIPLVALAFAGTSVSIRAEDASLDTAYLEEGLKVPHIIRLMNNTHPLSHDLIGKEYTFHYRDDKNNSAYFVDGEYIEWWVPSEPVKRIRKVKYAAFKITDDIYFVTWVDPIAMAVGPDGTIQSYDDNYIVAFVLDLKKMVVTDSWMRPNTNGEQKWLLMQATVEETNNR